MIDHIKKTDLTGRIFIVLLVLVLITAVLPSFVGASTNAESDDETSEFVDNTRQVEETYEVTLITGDIVTINECTDGQRLYSITPSAPEKTGQNFLTFKEGEDTYIVPHGVSLSKLDINLFNIDYLVDENYHEQESLPLLVQYKSGLPENDVLSLENAVTIIGNNTQLHNEAAAISTGLSYSSIAASYNILSSRPAVTKIWLDKKVHVQLDESIPIIGASSWWDAGYNGAGVTIAILDTGIDSTHPSLDDLDDDPGTSDPKVIANVNFSDDADFLDYYGHGTHVSGIAAGTYAGEDYQGVAPGAYLWNVKVLNEYGYGYESWIINGINYASLGPDGLPGTGDEADVINMSLGNHDYNDGTDPLSLAVNAAVEYGTVVVIAAGNDGSGSYTLCSPGTAEKAITVGATDKSDNLAYFSSRGPTADLRIKPDIVAPGVDIMSSVPDGVYEPHDGTSMATPHVAGAAALLIDANDGVAPHGMPLTQFVKDALMCSAEELGLTVYEQGGGRLDLTDCWGINTITETELGPGELAWLQEPVPDIASSTLVPGSDILDLVVVTDIYSTIYASTGSGLYKSIDEGLSWQVTGVGDITPPVQEISYIAAAPDDPDVVAIIDNVSPGARVTPNGGATWISLDSVPFTTAYDVVISANASGVRYIVVAGNGGIYYYPLGQPSPVWINACTDSPWTPLDPVPNSFRALELSPNFLIDYTMVAISENQTNGVVQYHAANFNSHKWNRDISGFNNYPVTVYSTPDILTVNAADIDLAPDYMGGNEVTRTGFIALAVTDNGTETGGIFRMNDYYVNSIMSTPEAVNNIDYNGTDLAAGAYESNIVWRSDDALATTPAVLPGKLYKRIGIDDVSIDDRTIVAWSGDELFGAKRGDASAVSRSGDYGNTWNDFTLMDSTLNTIDDIYVPPNSSALYIAANDWNGAEGEASVYRRNNSDNRWERVLCVPMTNNHTPAFLLRGAPEDNVTIYALDEGGTAMYFSTDGGRENWYPRTTPVLVADAAVESKYVVYIGGINAVQKSTNGGYTWEPQIYPNLQGDNIATIESLDTEKIIVGGSAGHVAFATDYDSSWVTIIPPVSGGGNVQSTASGTDTGDHIYAATDNTNMIYRWIIGTSVSWEAMSTPSPGDYRVYGIGMDEGKLYSAGTDDIDSSCWWAPNPTASPPDWYSVSANNTRFNKAPEALKISAENLWAIDTQHAAVYSCTHTLIDVYANDILATPASLNLGAFDSGQNTANGVYTFISGVDACDITLIPELIDIDTHNDYSSSVNLSSVNFMVPAGGEVDIGLEIDLTGLPPSVYSGKVTAVINGDSERTIHTIFGLSVIALVTVHKTDIYGSPAEGHEVWTINDSPYEISLVGYTDAAGNVTFAAMSDNLSLLSYGTDEPNHISIWTVAEDVVLTGTTIIELDERDTKIIDFNPNKPGQKVSAKDSLLVHVHPKWHVWESMWWYPDTFITRISPTSIFDAGFNYHYYPEDDFLPDNPRMVNTDEWHNLVYTLTGISDNTTLTADYSNLVHRHTGYHFPLTDTTAEVAQVVFSPTRYYFEKMFMTTYLMEAPQERWEWLSPEPSRIVYQLYRDASVPSEWSYDNNTSYGPLPAGEHEWSIGTQPLTSGIHMYVSHTYPTPTPTPTTTPPGETTETPTPSPPPTTEPPPPGEATTELSVFGPIFRDMSSNYLYYYDDNPGYLIIYLNGETIFQGEISPDFGRGVEIEESCNITVIVWDDTPLALSNQLYTVMDFTVEPDEDFHPPGLGLEVPGINLYGIIPAGEVIVRVYTEDSSPIASVNLSYSLNDGTDWTDAGTPDYIDGAYSFNLGQLNETFVSLLVEAGDIRGNSISQMTRRSFFVESSGITPPAVTTSAATNIGTTSATLNGYLDSTGDASSVEVSFEWGTETGVYTEYTAHELLTAPGPFSADITGLTPVTDYYFRARATSGNTTVYGNEASFQTAAQDIIRDLPVVTAPGATFEVIITFTAPEDIFNSIVLHDEAPSGWQVTVNTTACTPSAQTGKVYGINGAEYSWLGPFNAGDNFTAVYQVTVPAGTASGNYTFTDGWLVYYIGQDQYLAGITGDDTILAGFSRVTGMVREADCDILPGATVSLYKNDVLQSQTTSDINGEYELYIGETGTYTLVAGKDGYMDETLILEVIYLGMEYQSDFTGNAGIIPEEMDGIYFARCMNKYLFGTGECEIGGIKFAAIMNAYLYGTGG